jgi:hypothetical protein
MSKEEVKKGLTVKDQIEYLENNKNIIFKDDHEKDNAEKYLLKYSYSDVINPLKVLFCSGYDEDKKCHEYEYKTNWSDIEKLHREIKKVEGYLLKKVMQLELEMKSKLCDYIAKEIDSNKGMNFKMFLEKLETNKTKNSTQNYYEMNEYNYNKIYSRDYSDYKGTNFVTRWYLLIMSLSIGEIAIILKSKYSDETLLDLIYFPDFKLVEFGILRNSLAHGTSILVFLDKPLRSEKGSFKKRKDLISELLDKRLETNGIINEYKTIRNNNNCNRSKHSFEKYKL